MLIPFLKDVEGFSATKYRDSAGHYTIGYGHLITGKGDAESPITEARATELLAMDAVVAVESTYALVKVPLLSHEHAAVASWIFNLGEDKVRDSNTLRLLNENKKQQFADALLQWNKVTVNGVKKANKGLLNRRVKERKLFLYGPLAEDGN